MGRETYEQKKAIPSKTILFQILSITEHVVAF